MLSPPHGSCGVANESARTLPLKFQCSPAGCSLSVLCQVLRCAELDSTYPRCHKYLMAKLVDPTKLISLQQAGEEFGYTAEHLRVLAVAGRLEAWLVGTFWITTREAVLEYKKHSRPPGRPPNR